MQICRVDFRKQSLCISQNLITKNFCTMAHRCSGHKRLPGCIRARIKRSNIGILYGLDMYVFHIRLKCLCNHLGKYRICSLSDLCRAKRKLNTSVLIQRKSCTCNFQRDRPYAGLIRKQCHADTSSYISGLLCIFFSLFIPVNIVCTLFETFKNAVCIRCNRFQICICIKSLNQIFTAKFQRIHMNGICHIIHKTFDCKTYLRNSVATHGSAYRCIRINCIRLAADIRTGILQSPGSQSVCSDRMTMRSICSLIGIRVHIFCQKFSVFIYTRCQIKFNRVAGSCITECFFAADIQFYRSAADLCCQKCIQRLIKYILFITKTTTDIRFNNTHIAPRDSKCLSDNTTDDMRDLRRSHDHDPALFHIGIRDRILNMAMLNDRSLIGSLYNCFRLFHSFIHITDKVIGTCKNIVFFVKVDWRLTSIHGLTRMDLHWVFLVLHFYLFQCP